MVPPSMDNQYSISSGVKSGEPGDISDLTSSNLDACMNKKNLLDIEDTKI